MLELKRIYWTRVTLRMAYLAATVWLMAAVILSFRLNTTHVTLGKTDPAVTSIMREMFDGVLAAVTAPGLVIVALIITVLIIRSRDVRRRDPVRRFTRQQRREGMARAGGQCEMEAGFRRRRSSLSCCAGDGICAPFARLHLLHAATKFCRLVEPPLDHG